MKAKYLLVTIVLFMAVSSCQCSSLLPREEILFEEDFDEYADGSRLPSGWWCEGSKAVRIEKGHLQADANPDGSGEPRLRVARYRSLHVEGVPVAGVGVSDHGDRDGAAHVPPVVEQLAVGDQAGVGKRDVIVWHRRDYTPDAIIYYAPVRVESGDEQAPSFEAEPVEPHGWGLVPIVWTKMRGGAVLVILHAVPGSGDLRSPAEVAADPQEGFYVPPTSDATGASGAWVRQSSPAHTITTSMFGAVDDSTIDSSTAVQAALDYLSANGGKLIVDGLHGIGTQLDILVTKHWTIEGLGAKTQSGLVALASIDYLLSIAETGATFQGEIFVEKLFFDCANQSGGIDTGLLRYSTIQNNRITRIQTGKNGINGGGWVMRVLNNNISGVTGTPSGTGLYFNYPTSTGVQNYLINFKQTKNTEKYLK